METFKNWLTSKTIWAALVTIAPLISSLLGFDLGATMSNIVEIAGIVGVIYFRITASTKLNFPF